MSYEEYTWLRYYEDLYHRQKKVNNALAMQLGETTAKVGELEVALNRVVGSPFWRVLAPARKLYGLVKNGGHSTETSVRTAEASVCPVEPNVQTNAVYSARLEQYEDFYGQWIRKDKVEQKYKDYSSDSGRDRVREAIYKPVIIENLVGDNNPSKYADSAKWLVLISEKGQLANGYARRIGEAIDAMPEALFGYADEDYFYYEDEKQGKLVFEDCETNAIRRLEPNFKPDWSPDTLDSFFYFGHIALIRTDIADKLTWLGSKNAWVNVYDLFLQASELVGKHYDAPEVVHIPQVLFHNDASEYVDRYTASLKRGNADVAENSDKTAFGNGRYFKWKGVSEAIKEDLAEGLLIIGADSTYNLIKNKAFVRRNTPGKLIPGQIPYFNQISYDIPDNTLVSVLILSKDHPDTLRTCLTSFVERTDYDNLEFIVVDNGSSDANKEAYEELMSDVLREYPHKYIYEKMDFNFSKGCNIAAANATGDLLLFLNDDIEVVQKDWLRLMVGYAIQPHVGAVGAKLLYANTDKIQHIGITNLKIGPSHKLVIYPDDRIYYYGKNMLAHDMLGVTGACLLVEKQKLNQTGTFNEDFAVAYNDVELCMRIAKAGYTNIQCNGALLYHYESLTRGQDEGNDEKWNRLLQEKHRLYSLHPEYFECDPYYNVNLISNHSNYLSDYDYGYNIHLKHESVRQLDASKLAEKTEENFKISIDYAGVQAKHNLEEPVIIGVRGWSYLQGEDNSDHCVRVILKSTTTGEVFEVDSDAAPREDLEKTFPDERNIRLCGFVSKILAEDLNKDTYVIGLTHFRLNHVLTNDDYVREVTFTDSTITI